MYISVIFSTLKYRHYFINICVMSSACLNKVICHITDTYTQISLYITCTFTTHTLLSAA